METKPYDSFVGTIYIMNRESILQELGYTDSVLIGEGQESVVYDLHNGRVLKLLKRANFGTINKEKELYEYLAQYSFLIELPQIITMGECGETKFLLEKKLSGVPMDEVLKKTKHPKQRRIILRNMLSAIKDLSSTDLHGKPYGELITENPLQAESWASYFRQKVTVVFERNRSEIEKCSSLDHKTLPLYLKQFNSLVEDEKIPKSIVHGDFWPPNILLEEERVTAIIDFNEQTAVGDFRVDLASALAFTEKWLDDEEKEFLNREIVSLFGHIEPVLSLYILYYAFLFAGVKDTDQESYDWASSVLSRSDEILTER